MVLNHLKRFRLNLEESLPRWVDTPVACSFQDLALREFANASKKISNENSDLQVGESLLSLFPPRFYSLFRLFPHAWLRSPFFTRRLSSGTSQKKSTNARCLFNRRFPVYDTRDILIHINFNAYDNYVYSTLGYIT